MLHDPYDIGPFTDMRYDGPTFDGWEPYIAEGVFPNAVKISPCGLYVAMELTMRIKRTPPIAGILNRADWRDLRAWRWFPHLSARGNRRYYVERKAGSATSQQVALHPSLVSSVVVDHKNFQTLDNRRGNLRGATNRQNAAHVLSRVDRPTGIVYRGVSKDTRVYRSKPWAASAGSGVSGIRVTLGMYGTAEEAAMARDDYVRYLNDSWGDSWFTYNFPRFDGDQYALDGSYYYGPALSKQQAEDFFGIESERYSAALAKWQSVLPPESVPC